MNTVSIKIINACRVDGKSLSKGEYYDVSLEGAKLAVSAGRAVYDNRQKKKSKKLSKADRAEQPTDEPSPDQDGVELIA